MFRLDSSAEQQQGRSKADMADSSHAFSGATDPEHGHEQRVEEEEEEEEPGDSGLSPSRPCRKRKAAEHSMAGDARDDNEDDDACVAPDGDNRGAEDAAGVSTPLPTPPAQPMQGPAASSAATPSRRLYSTPVGQRNQSSMPAASAPGAVGASASRARALEAAKHAAQQRASKRKTGADQVVGAIHKSTNQKAEALERLIAAQAQQHTEDLSMRREQSAQLVAAVQALAATQQTTTDPSYAERLSNLEEGQSKVQEGLVALKEDMRKKDEEDKMMLNKILGLLQAGHANRT
jgi:hypothetical protein